MSWVTAIVSGIFGPLFSALASYFGTRRHDRKIEELGEANAKLENAVAGQQEVAEAASAGQAMSDSLARDPDELRRPDAHTRTDGS